MRCPNMQLLLLLQCVTLDNMFAIALIDSVTITRRAVSGAGPTEPARAPRPRRRAREGIRRPERIAPQRKRRLPARAFGTEGR